MAKIGIQCSVANLRFSIDTLYTIENLQLDLL